MIMNKIFKHTVSIKLSDEGILAWNYLIKCKVHPSPILRINGEQGLILKAKEMMLFEKRIKNTC